MDKQTDLYCFGGDDGTLIYYVRCRKCGTVILVDYSMSECMEEWGCPVCNPLSNCPFRYYTREELKKDIVLRKLIGHKVTLILWQYQEYQRKITKVQQLVNLLVNRIGE